MAAEIKRINPSGLPAFVTGDFNATGSPRSAETAGWKNRVRLRTFTLAANKVHLELEKFTGYGISIAVFWGSGGVNTN